MFCNVEDPCGRQFSNLECSGFQSEEDGEVYQHLDVVSEVNIHFTHYMFAFAGNFIV